MGDFFQGWRPKLGIVTLFIACFFAAGWAQSWHSECWFNFRSDNEHSVFFISDNSRICLVRMPDWCAGQVGALIERHRFGVSRGDLENIRNLWSFRDFGVGRAAIVLGESMDVVVVPYWAIVIPLTVLSVHLLFGKPRSKLAPETETSG